MTEPNQRLSAATAKAAGIPLPTDTAFIAMPPKVAKAINDVMAAVTKLKYSGHNNHGGYDFATIDDFLQGLRPLCAKHGLIILQDEESFELRQTQNKKGETVTWLVVTFHYTLAHSSGETWACRSPRTIMVNASMGPQSFGAAQSYSLKQYMRSLFQIATGEPDLDTDNDTATDTDQRAKPPPVTPPPVTPHPTEQHEVGAFILYDAFGLETDKFERPEDFLTALGGYLKDNAAWFIPNENDVGYIEKNHGQQVAKKKNGAPRDDGLTIAKWCQGIRKMATPPAETAEAR